MIIHLPESKVINPRSTFTHTPGQNNPKVFEYLRGLKDVSPDLANALNKLKEGIEHHINAIRARFQKALETTGINLEDHMVTNLIDAVRSRYDVTIPMPIDTVTYLKSVDDSIVFSSDNGKVAMKFTSETNDSESLEKTKMLYTLLNGLLEVVSHLDNQKEQLEYETTLKIELFQREKDFEDKKKKGELEPDEEMDFESEEEREWYRAFCTERDRQAKGKKDRRPKKLEEIKKLIADTKNFTETVKNILRSGKDAPDIYAMLSSVSMAKNTFETWLQNQPEDVRNAVGKNSNSFLSIEKLMNEIFELEIQLVHETPEEASRKRPKRSGNGEKNDKQKGRWLSHISPYIESIARYLPVPQRRLSVVAIFLAVIATQLRNEKESSFQPQKESIPSVLQNPQTQKPTDNEVRMPTEMTIDDYRKELESKGIKVYTLTKRYPNGADSSGYLNALVWQEKSMPNMAFYRFFNETKNNRVGYNSQFRNIKLILDPDGRMVGGEFFLNGERETLGKNNFPRMLKYYTSAIRMMNADEAGPGHEPLSQFLPKELADPLLKFNEEGEYHQGTMISNVDSPNNPSVNFRIWLSTRDLFIPDGNTFDDVITKHVQEKALTISITNNVTPGQMNQASVIIINNEIERVNVPSHIDKSSIGDGDKPYETMSQQEAIQWVRKFLESLRYSKYWFDLTDEERSMLKLK